MFSKFPIQLTKKGIYLKLKRDTLYLLWGAILKFPGFHSTAYNLFFPSYFVYNHFAKANPVRSVDEKLQGFSMVEVFQKWVGVEYPNLNVIVLHNINVSAKSIEFWAKLPTSASGSFKEDLVVLVCKDAKDLSSLIDNLPSNFADVYGFVPDEVGHKFHNHVGDTSV